MPRKEEKKREGIRARGEKVEQRRDAAAAPASKRPQFPIRPEDLREFMQSRSQENRSTSKSRRKRNGSSGKRRNTEAQEAANGKKAAVKAEV